MWIGAYITCSGTAGPWGLACQLVVWKSAACALFGSLLQPCSPDQTCRWCSSVWLECMRQVARDIVGRLMADPAFVQKMLIEVGLTTGTSLVWEYQQRRERFMHELDFVAINTLSLATSTAALVWLMSPNRASGVLKVRAARACLRSPCRNVTHDLQLYLWRRTFSGVEYVLFESRWGLWQIHTAPLMVAACSLMFKS